MTMRGRCSLWQVMQSLKATATGLFMPFLFTFHFIEFHQHISTPCVSPNISTAPIFLGCFVPHKCNCHDINTISVHAYPNRSDDRPPWASWSPVMRNPADLQERSVISWVPLMPWNHMEPHLPILAFWGVHLQKCVLIDPALKNVKLLNPETCP